jgi:hypothetical protein
MVSSSSGVNRPCHQVVPKAGGSIMAVESPLWL